MAVIYFSTLRRKPLKFKTLGSTEDWVKENHQWYCPMWNTSFKDNGLCSYRKNIAEDRKKRSYLNVADGGNFATFERCLECQGAVSLTEKEVKKESTMRDFLEELANKKIQEKFIKTNQTENIVAGMPSTCETCGKQFEAFQRGRMIIYKKCKDCIKAGILKTKENNDDEKLLTRLTKETETPIQPEPQVVLPIEEEKRLVPEIPVPAVWPPSDVFKKHWVNNLFQDETPLLEKLEKEAKSQRRDLKQHILFILEKRFEDF